MTTSVSQPDVSIIVPVYKVESSIGRCARSLFSQNLKKLEIIFIDDCSPDRSIEVVHDVLEDFPQRKANTRFIRTPKNSGQAYVRRLGMLAATGKYLIHCDSDDWVDENLYSTLLHAIIEYDADMAICDFAYEYVDKRIDKVCAVSAFNGKQVLENLPSNYLHMSLCNKLVKRSIFTENDIFPWEGIDMWEDNGVMYRTLYFCEKIVHCPGIYYHYNKCNEGAITTDYGEKQVNQMIETAEKVSKFFELKPDRNRFSNTVKLLKFLAKINLITISYSGIKKYNDTFPGAEKIKSHISYDFFSSKGLIRFLMVKYRMKYLFVTVFKIYKKFR